MNSELGRRGSGVLLHITSLPGAYGCGTLGKSAFDFVDFLAESGYTYWQMLPLSMPDRYHSPYASYGAFSGNMNMVDLPMLYEEGLLSDTELADAEIDSPYAVAFDKLAKERFCLLKKAALRLRNRKPVTDFMMSHPHTDVFCRFMALRNAYPELPLTDLYGLTPDADTYYAWQFIEYTFYRQWQRLKNYANNYGVRLIGDIPIYVSYNSADVFENPRLFYLNEEGKPIDVAGVPPDDFSVTGQLWNNPLYRWDEMKKDGFRWWRDRLTHALQLFDGVRLDHFRGFEAYYAIPASEKTAENGVWRLGPGLPFVEMLREVADNKLIIAEDLGIITPQVENLVNIGGFASTRVFQFAFTEGNERHIPYAYPQNAVAYSGTHDNNTWLGFIFDAPSDVRRKIFDYCGYGNPRYEESFDAVRKTLLASHADTVIFPLQDLLRFGSDTRMNTPGRAVGNWSYRVTEEQLSAIDKESLKNENILYGRY